MGANRKQLKKAIQDQLRVCVVKPPLAQNRVTIKPASKTDVDLIKKWIEDGSKKFRSDEAKFLGAKSKRLDNSEIMEWITNSVGAYLLYVDDRPVAFGNIAPKEEDDLSRLETGRLVVDPDHREEGFGSTLVRNLCLALSSAFREEVKQEPRSVQPVILGRVVPSNNIGRLFVESLPFSKLREEKTAIWFQYYLDRRKPQMLGEAIERLRQERKMSQAELSFQCGVQRPTISMIESAKRIPSDELLQAVCRVLSPHDQLNRIKLLLALIGEVPEETLRMYQTVTTSIADKYQNLWLAIDRMAEHVSDEFFNNTKEAIRSGYDRFFFMPPGEWKRDGISLKTRLETELPGSFKNNLAKHFKFYEVPEGICHLRLAIENPSMGELRATVGGEHLFRMPLPKEQAVALYSFIKKAMLEADHMADKGEGSVVNEFLRCFPSKGKGNGDESKS